MISPVHAILSLILNLLYAVQCCPVHHLSQVPLVKITRHNPVAPLAEAVSLPMS